MYKKNLKKISHKLHSSSEKEYFILTHKKHKREIYFQNNKDAIEFIKIKFNSPLKKLTYFLIKLKILQPFLEKIKLSSELGEVIFVANQVKCFDLKNKIVSSFTKNDSEKKSFIKTKKLQKKIAEKGFASDIYELNKDFPFSKEELLQEYKEKNDFKLFKKLYSFYKQEGIEKITLNKYVNFLIKKFSENNIKDPLIESVLKKINQKNQKILIATIHGAFAKEQVLLKNDSYVFIDWESEKNLIIRDLVLFFRNENNFLKNQKFLKLLKIYPPEVRQNIRLYLLLNEIYQIAKNGKIIKKSKKRIESILKETSS